MLLSFILKSIVIKSTRYLIISINVVEKDEVDGNEYKSIRKIKSEIIEILTKLQSWDFSKSRSRNLSKLKNFIKFQNTNIIAKLNFLISNIKINYIKLKQLLI